MNNNNNITVSEETLVHGSIVSVDCRNYDAISGRYPQLGLADDASPEDCERFMLAATEEHYALRDFREHCGKYGYNPLAVYREEAERLIHECGMNWDRYRAAKRTGSPYLMSRTARRAVFNIVRSRAAMSALKLRSLLGS